MTHVVTCFLRHRGAVLLTRRSDAVGTYRGRWAGVSGYVEGDPADALADARREIREETGRTDAALVRAGDPLTVRDGDREWTVHPFLFSLPSREVAPNEELAATEWVAPPVIRERETVPGLWAAYRRVAPTVADTRSDTERGAAALSVTALEVLRDAAAAADDWEAVAGVARDLRDARPDMVAVANRVNRVLASTPRDPESVADRAHEAVGDAREADEAAATAAASELGDAAVVATLSRSGTVAAALDRVDAAVVLSVSRPGGEGVSVAESLAVDRDVTLTSDAALPGSLARHDVDAVLVGADSVHPDGAVLNKVGTYPLALAAAAVDVPVYVVTATDKVRPGDPTDGTANASGAGTPGAVDGETAPPTDLYDGPAAVSVENPVFESVPADLVTIVTERGVLDRAAVAALADRHARYAAWDDDAAPQE